MFQKKLFLTSSFFIFLFCLGMIAEAQDEPTVSEKVYDASGHAQAENTDRSNVQTESREDNLAGGAVKSEEEPKMYACVYYDDEPGENHFSDFGQALGHVEEGGILYLGKPADITKSFPIDRSLTIRSLNPLEPTLKLGTSVQDKTVFDLKNISRFRLDGVYAIGSNAAVIGGHADRIEISGCRFEWCYPLFINSDKDFSIHMENSQVHNGNIEIAPNTAGEKSVVFHQNHFLVNTAISKNMRLKNIQGVLSGNRFEGYSLVLMAGGEDTEMDVFENVFCDPQKGKIIVSREGQNSRFHRNHILKDFSDAIAYSGTGKLDFRYNWWGRKEGPAEIIDLGKLSVEPWALFPDFRRFQGEPYTREDLQELCRQIGADIDAENWIYDIQPDQRIDLLDAVALIRRWIE